VVFFDFKINPLTQQANIVYSSNNILRLQTWNTNSNAWEQIGTTIDEISSAYLSLAFNKNGQPYVAYTASTADLSSSFVAVKTYDQNSWQDLASPNLVANSQMDNYLQLTISPAQVPYFILSNSDNSEANDLYKPIVMDFTDNNWSYPDNNKLISAGMAIYPHISFNPATGQPYITYADLTSSEIQVLDFNGSSWNKLGSQANFSSSAYNNLGFDAITNEPYVAFLQSTDGNAPYKANLMAYK
jgi:hypothetical protein